MRCYPVFCHLLPRTFDVHGVTALMRTLSTASSVRLHPGQCFTIWCDGLSCPQSYLFFTLYQSTITLEQSHQSLPKHVYSLSVLYGGNCQSPTTPSQALNIPFGPFLFSPTHYYPLCLLDHLYEGHAA